MRIKNIISLVVGMLLPVNHLVRKITAKIQTPTVYFYRGSRLSGVNKFEGYNPVRYGAFVRNCQVGVGTYIFDGAHLDSASIGRYSSISDQVRIILGSHPNWGFINTSPTFLFDTSPYMIHTIHRGAEVRNPLYHEAAPGFGVVIGNDVWIGPKVLILDGVVIGDGSIVQPGSVVDRDVEPYSIVGGVPATLKRKRYNDAQIEFLLAFKWWDKGIDWVREHYREMDDIDSFTEKYGS